MKQFFLTAAAAAIGVSLALAGYEYFIVGPREAERIRVDAARAQVEAAQARIRSEAAKVELSNARNEARQVAAEVEASVERSVETARKRMDEQAVQMDRRALAADALSRAAMFRVALTEYYQSNMHWPQSAADAGLPPPEQTRGGAVRGIALGAQGAITIALDEHFAAGSSIVLRPVANEAVGGVEWHCEAKGDALLKQALPRC